MAAKREPCESCGHSFLISLDRCPHCGRPGLFPNVRLASQNEEREALRRRYEAAAESAKQRDCGSVLQSLETATTQASAVIARDHLEILRLSSSEDQLYSTYYQQIEAGVRLPAGDKWDVLREFADTMLFGARYRREVHHGALSLDEVGVTGYGDVSVVLAEEMISHRASLLEENSVIFQQNKVSDPNDVPAGYRARWKDRSLLCAAKLAGRLKPETDEKMFSELLLKQGTSKEEDEFVEVHVGGPISARSLVKAVVTKSINRSLLERLRIQLDRFGVKVEARGWTP